MRVFLPLILIIIFKSFNVSSQTNEFIRFDGVYQSETQGDYRQFIRFYQDGTVITVSCTCEVKGIEAWFNKENLKDEDDSSGKYEIKETKIYFTSTSSYGTVVYYGTLTNEYTINLNIKSLINDYENQETYYFIKF